MFSTVLNKLLSNKRVRQSELAYYLDVHPSQVSRYCSGESEPSYSMIKKIAEFLEVEPASFFTGYIPTEIIQETFFIDDAAYRIESMNHKQNCCILSVKYYKERKWAPQIVELAEKHNVRFALSLIKGRFYQNKKTPLFTTVELNDNIFFEAGTEINLICSGNMIPFYKELTNWIHTIE